VAGFPSRGLRWLYRTVLAVSVLAVLLLLATGLLLNHGTGAGLAQLPFTQDWLRRHYALPTVAGAGPGLAHQLPTGELAVHEGRLYFNERVLGDCPRLVGVVEQPGQVLAACSNSLFLLTPDGELIRQADTLRGIPDGLSAVTRAGDAVLLRQGESLFSLDLGNLSVAPAGAGSSLSVPGVEAPGSVDGERLLRDLHSGRVFGRYGPWLVDALVVFVAAIALTGLLRTRRQGRPPR
jgi:hypothetical protein